MATGDLIAAAIEIRNLTPCIALTFEGMATGGVLTPGFAAYASPIGTTLVTLTLDFEGFSNGGVVTRSKTIYPTRNKRTPYNGTDTPDDITVSGSDIIVRFALDNWVYAGCTNGLVTVSSGVYTESGTPNNASIGFSVTNNVADIPYPTPKANYTVPVAGLTTLMNPYTYTKDTSGFFEVRIYADNCEEIDCVKVTATGQTSGAPFAQTVTATLEVDQSTYNDALPFPEYIARIPYSGFTQGEIIDVVPVVYPKIGDTALDFSATGYSMPTAKPCTHTIICDKDGSYGYSVAVIDPAGNNGTGVVVDFDAFNPLSPPAAFLTRGGAYLAILAYNAANFSRTNDAGGGFIFAQAGTYDAWGQYLANYTNTSNLVTAPFPGVAKASVIINAVGFDNQGPDEYDMLSSVTVNAHVAILYSKTSNVILYNCDMDLGVMYSDPNAACVNVIGCNISYSNQGLAPYSNNPYTMRVRGITCTHNANTKTIAAEITVGCNFDNTTLSLRDVTGAGTLIAGGIFCFNRHVISDGRSAVNMTTSTTNGWAINNNVIIQQGNTSIIAEPLVYIYGDGSDVNPCNDWMLCNNTILGERCNMWYNDYNLAGVGPGPRILIRIDNNIISDQNHITDIHEHGGGTLDATDGDRYGNHSLVHGTWNTGNYGTGTGAGTDSRPTAGVNNYYVVADYEAIDFVDDQSGRPGAAGSGDGDYHLAVGAAPIKWAFKTIIPYDLDGLARPAADDAGAYSYSAANSGGGAFRRRRSRAFVALL